MAEIFISDQVGSVMPRTERDRELTRRRIRKVKIAKLRKRYAVAKTESEKEELLNKARRLSPFIELEPSES